MSVLNPPVEPPRAHVRVVYLGPVSPHWEIDSDFGDRALVEEFRRNRERIMRDAEREHVALEWDLGLADGEDI